MIDLQAHYLQEIKNILQSHIPNYEVRAFGSRIQGTANKNSDLDLVICANHPLKSTILWDLEEEFSESDLPFRVDVLDWEKLAESFQQKIAENFVVIQKQNILTK